MVYIILNALVVIALGLLTYLFDVRVKNSSDNSNSLSVSMLLATFEAVFFLICLLVKDIWMDALTSQIMRLVFCLDGIFFVSMSFGFIGTTKKIKSNIVRILRFVLCAFVVYLVYAHFNSVSVSYDHGIVIESEYLFYGEARRFFPWTWVTLYTVLYRYVIPVICFLFLMVLQEDKANQLEKYQSILMAEGVVLMWCSNFIITILAKASPAFSVVFMYPYLFMFTVIYSALTKTSVPSGKSLFVTVIKFLVSYLLPAAAIGAYCFAFQPEDSVFKASFLIGLSFISIIVVMFALKIFDILSSSTRFYAADYEHSLEIDLAKIDYAKGEMDQITNKMFETLKRNVESSSMSVYILLGKNELEMAYSSNNIDVKIPVNDVMFEKLLNINKSVVIASDIEKEHSVADIQDELRAFFDKTESDALFILNEGHNIFGIITLGRKISGDHYKEYDYNVFEKLYSYFFVFGYYMRNISNKDVIGVVNREIKMSSQIITSIQENIDQIKNPKADIGYLMVPSHNIGGEFVDLVRLTDTRHLLVVGDLSGKGIAASMNMVILKSIIRTYLAETHDFKELVVKVNSFIRESLIKGTIFAGIFALVDFETDTMYYINCGIPALFMYTQVYNNVIEIQGSGHILGFVKDIGPYISVKTTKLNRGDIILACTDGLVSSHSLRGEPFGKERIQQAILDNSTYPAQRMAQFTFDGLLKFMSKEMEDDVSILIMKYESSAAYADMAMEEAKEQEAAAEETVNEEVSETPVEESSAEPSGENVIENNEPFAEPEEETAAVSAVEEQPVVEEAEQPSENKEEEVSGVPGFDDPDLPDDMPDLSDLDAMMKLAGL